MPEDLTHRLYRGIVWLTLGLVAFYLIYYQLLPALWEIINFFVPLLLPFVLGIVFAAIMNPAVNWGTARWHLPRGAVVLLVMVCFLALALTLLTILVSQLVAELSRLSSQLPAYAEVLKDFFADLQGSYSDLELPAAAAGAFQDAVDALLGLVREATGQALAWLVDLIAGLPVFFVLLLVTVMATFFFSRDYHLLGQSLQRVLPSSWRKRLPRLAVGLNNSFLSYVRAEIILISVTGALTLVGLLLLHVDYAVTLSVLSALLDLLPVVGPGTIFIPWAIGEFLGGNYIFGLALVILYAIITVARQLLEPRVLARSLGVHPLIMLAALYVGLKALGPWGVIIGPLVVIAGKAFWQSYRSGRESY